MSKNRAKIKSLTMLLIGRTVETEKGRGRPLCFWSLRPSPWRPKRSTTPIQTIQST